MQNRIRLKNGLKSSTQLNDAKKYKHVCKSRWKNVPYCCNLMPISITCRCCYAVFIILYTRPRLMLKFIEKHLNRFSF